MKITNYNVAEKTPHETRVDRKNESVDDELLDYEFAGLEEELEETESAPVDEDKK
jgi:hypothetical protein